METKHTPAPWIIDPNPGLPLGVIEDNEDGNGICEIDGTGPVAEANARLIAAAPDLLAALEEVSYEISRLNRAAGETVFNPAATGMARAAIAKAKNEQ